MKRSILVLTSSCTALCLLIAAGCSQKSKADNSSVVATVTAPKPEPKATPDFTLTAMGLAMEAKVDADLAKEKYTGKQIVITGRVQTVSDERMEVMLETLVTDFLACKFDVDAKNSLMTLKADQQVKLQCEGAFDTLDRPEPKHCVKVD